MSDVSGLLSAGRYIFFDGALGTMLQKHGLEAGQKTETMNMTSPGTVEMVHRMYIEAGSDIFCTNTLCANALSLKSTGYSARQVIEAALQAALNAKKAAGEEKRQEQMHLTSSDAAPPLAALDIGPIGQLLEPYGDLSFEHAYELFREMAVLGEACGADLAAIETMSDIEEVRAAMTAVKDNTNLPVFVTMTFDKSGRTFMGCTPEKFIRTAEELGAAAAGINCSLEPEQMYDIVKRMAEVTRLPLIVKPNAGLPGTGSADHGAARYYTGPDEFAGQMLPYAQMGVKVVGGCCGTTPEHIMALKKVFV